MSVKRFAWKENMLIPQLLVRFWEQMQNKIFFFDCFAVNCEKEEIKSNFYSRCEREKLNIKGRKASSNTSSLHVLSSLPWICDERIFHKIYLARSKIISALLLGDDFACVFKTLKAACEMRSPKPFEWTHIKVWLFAEIPNRKSSGKIQR